MANKRIVIKQWNWWISNDPNVWQAGSFAYGEWVEIRTNSKKVEMSQNWWSLNFLTTANNPVVAYNIIDANTFLRFHYNWEITDNIKNDIDTWNYIVKIPTNIYNAWVITTNAWVYDFIISWNKVYKWAYVAWSDFWIYDSWATWIVTDWEFDVPASWTIWANWSVSWWLATHTAWNTAVLKQTITPDAKTYRFEVVCWTITANSCQLRLWWVSQYTFSASDSNKTVVFTYTATWASIDLEFVPFSWFAWSFQSVQWQVYNITSQTHTSNFQIDCPILYGQNTFYIWSWNKLVKVDTSISTWVISDALTIDLDYTIKGITRIWDQIFVYATNLSSSKQYLWDWSSVSALRQITWVDKPIMNVANFANIDYVFTGWWVSNKTQMFRVDWYQLTLLYQNTINSAPWNERIYFSPKNTNAIETIWTKLLIPWLWWIYTYGQFTPWMPTSLVKEYTNYFNTISAMYYTEYVDNNLWYSWYWIVNWVTGIYEKIQWLVDIYSTLSPWYIQLNPYFWDCLSNKKNSQRFVLWCKWTTGKNWINIYSKNDDIKWYAEILIQKPAGTMPTVWSVYSISSKNYTITNVLDTWLLVILQCTCPTDAVVTEWTISKVSWTWNSTFYADKIRYDYKYITTISTFDTVSKARFIYNYPENFQELSFAFELITNDVLYTPAIYDFNLYYDETDDWN